MLEGLARRRRERKKRQEAWRQFDAEATKLVALLLKGPQPLDWLLKQNKISQALYDQAIYVWWKSYYLLEIDRAQVGVIYDQRIVKSRWFALTDKGRHVLKYKYRRLW